MKDNRELADSFFPMNVRRGDPIPAAVVHKSKAEPAQASGGCPRTQLAQDFFQRSGDLGVPSSVEVQTEPVRFSCVNRNLTAVVAPIVRRVEHVVTRIHPALIARRSPRRDQFMECHSGYAGRDSAGVQEGSQGSRGTHPDLLRTPGSANSTLDQARTSRSPISPACFFMALRVSTTSLLCLATTP